MKTVLAGAAPVFALLLGSAAAAGERLVVVEHPVNETTTHLGSAKVDTLGDVLTFLNPVFDAANKKQVGTDQGFCLRVAVGKSWECNFTLLLTDGRITVEGPFSDDGDSVFTIIGGTGKYAGAKGQLKLHPRDAKSTAYDFTYDML